MYAMNVTAILDDLAYKGVCSSAMYAWWATKFDPLNPTKFTNEEWIARCGSLDMPDFGDVAAQIAAYFDPKEAASMLAGGGGKSLLSEIAKYFIPLCVKSCSDVTSFNA